MILHPHSSMCPEKELVSEGKSLKKTGRDEIYELMDEILAENNNDPEA